MRIIYLHQYFNTPNMSGGTRSYEMARRLVAHGHKVHMITTWRIKDRRRDWFETEESGIHVHWLPVPYANTMSYRARIVAFLKFAVNASQRAISLGGDIVFATSTPLTVAIPGIKVARTLRVPMVFEVRDLWPEMPIAIGAIKHPFLKWAAQFLERYAYKNSSRIVTLSPGMAAGVERSGYLSSKISVIPNSADLDFFRRDELTGAAVRKKYGIPLNRIVIGYTGTLGRVNGVGYLVDVAAELQDDSRFAFVVVGDGQERECLRERAKQKSVLDKNLVMLERIPKFEMPALLSGIDIATSLFLPLPEMEANSANKFFDALAAGCCVAINYGGWQARLLQEARAGVCLDWDVGRAAEQLQALADSPSTIRQCGLNARKLGEQYFSREVLALQLEQTLLDAICDSSDR